MKTKIYTFAAMILLAGALINHKVYATIHQVMVSDHVFTPSSLNVTVGDTVEWVWVNGSHTTTSGIIPGAAAAWDRQINSTWPTYFYAVTVAGMYNYVCTYHASMGMVGSFNASNPNNTLAVAPANQNVPAAAGNTSFTVTSNTSWNAGSNASWCPCTPSGTGNGSITATFGQNTSSAQRIATITVTASGVTDQQVTVTQAGSGLGVNDPATGTFVIYPNPFSAKLNISSESLKTSAEEIIIYSIRGLMVLGPITITGSQVSVDLSNIPDGVYFVRIGDDKTGKVQKIVKAN